MWTCPRLMKQVHPSAKRSNRRINEVQLGLECPCVGILVSCSMYGASMCIYNICFYGQLGSV